MRTCLAVLVGVVLAAAAADGAEPPKKAPVTATPEAKQTVATKTDTAHDAPEPKTADATADTKADDHPAPAKRKVPMVSRVAPPVASPAAAHAPATAGHAAEPAADGHTSAAAAHAAAPSASGSHGGYVATGARPKAAVAAAGKAKPTVSGTPVVSKAPAADHAAAPAHEGAGPGPSARPAPRGLARLSDVHERIAAALASLKDDASRADGRTDADAGAGGDGPGARLRTPRITLRWPAPRWRVRWASLPSSAGSLPAPPTIAPPVPSLVALPAPRLPAPLPVSAQPPDRH